MNRILDFRVHYLCSSWSVRKLLSLLGAFPVAHWYRIHLPVQEMQETWVRSLGREDSLEEEMATHSSILAWKVHGQRSLVGYSPWGHTESDMTK